MHGYIGIDIGGTKSLFALFDDKFEVIAEDKFRTHPEKGGAKAFTKAMNASVATLMAEAKRRGLEVPFAGVGCAGDIDMKEGVVRDSPNLTFLEDYPFRQHLEKATGARVFIGHDVQAGLYGEYRLGAARKGRNVVGVWIGTGVGGAIILDGRLFQGSSGRAGDIGNFVLHAGEVGAEPGEKEVLDDVASRSAIAGEAAALAAKHRAPTLRKVAGTDVSDIKSGDLAEAIRQGDKAVEKLVRARAAVVGSALASLVDFLNPDHVVLGGGLVESLPRLIKAEVRKAIDNHATEGAAGTVKVVVAKLHGHAGTIGAARLAIDMYSPHPPIHFPD